MNFKSIKQTKFHADSKCKTLMIFVSLQVKLQLFQDYKALLLCTSNYRKFFWQSLKLKKVCFPNFTMLQRQQKSLYNQAHRALRIKQF